MTFSAGVAVAVNWLVPPAYARPVQRATGKPIPSAHDVEKSRQLAKDRAADVGRTKAELAQADGELDRLNAAAEAAVERYNGERVKLERSQQAYQGTRQRLAEATRKVGEAQDQLAAFAARVYQNATGYDQVSSAISGRGGPQGFMDRAGMVEVLAGQRTAMVRRVEASKTVADVFRRQAQTSLQEQAAATRDADQSKRLAQTAVAEQQASIQRITDRKRALEKRLGDARARAARLARARERALEARAASKARAAGKERAAGEARTVGKVRAGLETANVVRRGAMVAEAALEWLGTPYSWGGGTAAGPSLGVDQGAGILGFDCSGLAMYAWGKAGIRLDHWTGTQWTSGPHVPIDRLRPGDLVFFATNTSDPGTIHHVGVYIGNGRMVEAPYTGARVRISSIHRSDLIGATRPAG
ncbi:NlpC/P60 family protein [Actinomadura opuntiae]|uniref:NlpC/P60 family protein n=1 Tax=Actinomadura sp. OS1-43 TaxID=604315 RepID=UPI00255B00AE|nr:NlpC/P60 family protein [Actinomadura sp. OS1-43]MDL4813793.1 NlpC/P60 family protein [Actinomadura sp. OS1-43]